MYVGGWFLTPGSNNIAKWDETVIEPKWSALGSGLGGSEDVVAALTQDKNGDLIAGGKFPYNIAQLDGSQWEIVGGGIK